MTTSGHTLFASWISCSLRKPCESQQAATPRRMTTAWGKVQGSYSSSGLVIAGDDYLLLLDCQWDCLERWILVLKDAGVEAVLWSGAEFALLIAQAQSHMGMR
ncbi:DNA/RNA polymerase [Pyrenophora tritici-repentis]|uniref:DinP, Nucleotidyltransferase-DNA polymerase involved in DNA repair n=1 Tax=Pyrenophora tritici-repentis TaxID=45151 RepID=A0A2W1HX94_9PLEO|nr:DinP, Nucleotidyltransferase-DNA polymerase involved in DNA repair [Pyrenophora tritici-repentis]KAG9383448.1 DNA/RNA polymerase [Pyrenophora tritici-repentis]KAI0575854.1 DNA/RNA polymerase [Pyrenophora tritici-repentis]KAI0580602.1 DNA/RNA polymerase [Pyrenophora tritici-repentis]KAI1562968.1 DinP Nucleotidyltransferase DNA polymerase [Pyrenophora tritici-repentis]